MTDSSELKIINYAVVRASGYYYPAAIVAVDAVTDKTVSGHYPDRHRFLMSGQGAISIHDKTARWTKASDKARVARYRIPVEQVLATFDTLSEASAAFEAGLDAASKANTMDRTQLEALDTWIRAARDEETAARERAEALWRDRSRLWENAERAKGVIVRRAMGLPEPDPAYLTPVPEPKKG